MTYMEVNVVAPLRKERNSSICGMDETGGHYAKWTKSEKDKYHRISSTKEFQKKKKMELRVESDHQRLEELGQIGIF